MDGLACWQGATTESLFLQGSDPIQMCHSVQGFLIHRDPEASNYPGNLAFSGQMTGESFYLTQQGAGCGTGVSVTLLMNEGMDK